MRRGGRRKENKRPRQESLKFRILIVIPPFYRSAAFRGFRETPRGGEHQHPTPKAGALNARHRRRWGDDERDTKDRPPQESLKLRMIVVIPPFYRSVASCGVLWGSGRRSAGCGRRRPAPNAVALNTRIHRRRKGGKRMGQDRNPQNSGF